MFVLTLLATVAAHDWSAAELRVVDEAGRGLSAVALTLRTKERQRPLGVTDALGWSGLMILPPHSSITAALPGYSAATVALEGGREALFITLKKEAK